MVNLMKLPKTSFRKVGETRDINKVMNDFFFNTKEYIQKTLMEGDNNSFEVKSARLIYGLGEDKEKSDNRITYMEYKEKWVVAGMLETRTRLNDLEFTFFRDLSCLKNSGEGGIRRGVY